MKVCDAMTPRAPLSIRELDTLVNAMLEIPRMSETSFRDLVFSLLPSEVVQHAERDQAPRADLLAMFGTFEQFPHLAPWAALRDALRATTPESTEAAKAIGMMIDYGLHH